MSQAERMNIAIACHPTYGGSGVVAAELGMQLAERGHEVHFVSYEAPFRIDPLQPNVFFHEVEVTSYPLFRYPPYALALATKLVDVVRSHGVRLLHVHYAIPHAISAFLTKQMCPDCDVRILTTLHGTDITLVGSDPSFQEISRFGIAQSDGITAVSDYLARATRRHFRVERPIEVIPNFVDVERFSPERADPALRARFAAPDERLLVHVSNFRTVKRVPDVVEVFARIAAVEPARLLMVGSGPARAPAEEELTRLGLIDRATFLGPVDEVAPLLATSDLLLLPSENESFGLAALEAMASGVPVIATRTGGLPEVVEDGETGILADVGGTTEMAERGLEILRDERARRRMGDAARERAVDRYRGERVLGAYEAAYQRLLAEPHVKPA